MHILLALIGIITFLAVWYWRIRMISGAARGSYEAAKTVIDFPRRRAARQRTRATGINAVNDPREAAAIMMLQIARTRGMPNDTQEAAIRAEMIDHFGFSDSEAQDWLTGARRRLEDAPAPQAVISRMSDVITATPGMGLKEFDELCSMLENVAVAGGHVSTQERDLIQVWRQKAGLN